MIDILILPTEEKQQCQDTMNLRAFYVWPSVNNSKYLLLARNKRLESGVYELCQTYKHLYAILTPKNRRGAAKKRRKKLKINNN